MVFFGEMIHGQGEEPEKEWNRENLIIIYDALGKRLLVNSV